MSINETDQTAEFRSDEADVGETEASINFPNGEKLGFPSSSLTRNFNESIRQLLRNRLLNMVATILFFLFVIKCISITLHGISLSQFLSRLVSIAVCSGCWFYLLKNPDIDFLQLRLIEVLTLAIPVFEAMLVLVQEVQERIDLGDVSEVPTIFALISFSTAIIIAIYGLYVPANWQRIATFTTLAGLCPAATAYFHSQFVSASIPGYPEIISITMTLAMSTVVSYASHLVQSVRRQAAEAKYYGQYQLLDEIGSGGMGRVFKARHRMLKRPAAIKLIRTDLAKDLEKIAEFEHEVQLSASLSHWNTVQIYDYGRTESGEFYCVMEFLEGMTLGQKIRRGKLSMTQTVHIISQICDGLAEAHDKGMIHRDIKPANLFLTEIGNDPEVVKILDFGIAVMKHETFRLQKVSGTPAYMSPEQIRSGQIDSRSDIYALGLVIFECLAGHRLMAANSMQELLDMHTSKNPSLHEIPDSAKSFIPIIEKCVEKDPSRRYRDVTELKTAIRNLIHIPTAN
ncbi:MAG: serine/threonine-protein kinase [Planctomycetota bacterium]